MSADELSPARTASETRAWVAARYELFERIGEGGMAVVERAFDHSTNTEVALKRLRPADDETEQGKALRLFEREYETLSQLAHPRVVRVYDYGVDGETAYYTMELVDGGDLDARTPVDWRTACALMRDVCSVLALLHSRRLVHRDISPRNIRCTTGGLAKLIDFGAMVPMGAGKQPVGTPPVCPPEALDRETLDARADLYSLGATLYYALVGQNAYPARTLSQLRAAWEAPPARPSEFVPEIPKELDALVMRLLSFDPADRPLSAAEVMERLSAIAELPADEQLHVSHAYLSSPTLVGREASLVGVRKQLERARAGQGAAMMALGEPGAGRSRFLDACLLEAKLGGATVVRVDAGDAHQGDYGAVHGLGTRLLQARPELAQRCARDERHILGHLIPELTEGSGVALQQFEDAQQRRPTFQQALRRWLLGFSNEQPLVIGVDDVDRVDEPSAAFIALLAHDAPHHRMVVLSTAEQEVGQVHFGALKLLSDVSTRLAVPRLGEGETEQLLRSVFGDAPNVHIVARKLHRISRGNARDIMQLAQHLVDEGTIRYESGSWLLPSEIDDPDLPASIAQALRRRVATLGREALDLARPWALVPELSLSTEELQSLTSHGETGRTMQALDELLANGILRANGNRFELGQRGWVGPLLADVSPQDIRELHKRLSASFMKQGDEFRAAQHLLHADELDCGIDALVEDSKNSKERTEGDPEVYARLLASLPDDWLETYQRAVRVCREWGRPNSDLYWLLLRMSGLDPGGRDTTAVSELIELLTKASGLDIYHTLDESMDPKERLDKTFELAQQRYEQTPEADRIAEPLSAIRPLAQMCVMAVAMVARSLDYDFWKTIPSLKPFEPLSPAIRIVNLLIEGIGYRITGRTAEAIETYEALVERASQPDGAELEESYRSYTVFGVICGMGFLEAPLGLDSALERAKIAEQDPPHQVDAVQIRVIYHLWQGQVAEADACKQKVELLRIERSLRQWYEAGHLMGELTAYAAADDLVRVRQTLAEIALMAETMPAWVPIFHFARSQYHRIRGAYSAALQELEVALPLAPPGRHQLWAEIAAAHIHTLDLVREHAQAVTKGEEALEAASQHNLGYQTNFIRMSLAVALAHRGQRQRAQVLADEALRDLYERGASTLLCGLAHEARARVALHFRDHDVFEQQAQDAATLFKGTSNRALSSRSRQLVDEAQQAGMDVPDSLFNVAEPTILSSSLAQALPGELDTVSGTAERADKALQLMMCACDAVAGALYAVHRDGPVLRASRDLPQEITSLDDFVREALVLEMPVADRVTAATVGTQAITAQAKRIHLEDATLHPVCVGHTMDGEFHVTGMAVLMVYDTIPFVPPIEIATRLSDYWYSAGDTTSLDPGMDWLKQAQRAKSAKYRDGETRPL